MPDDSAISSATGLPETAGLIKELSNELRAPITVVVGYLETMLGSADDNWRPAIEQMLRQTHRVDRILSSLLTLISLESSTEEPENTELAIAPMVNMIFEEIRLVKPKQTLEFTDHCSARLCGGETELYTALYNVIDNASRHSGDDGNIQVTWQLEGGLGYLSVIDNGPGIDPDQQARLGERFYRTDLNSVGAGLGLAIVKQVLGRHQAELQIESTAGQGSTFRCVFPAERIVNK